MRTVSAPTVAAATAAAALAATAFVWGSTAIGGADQYGYITAAGLLRERALVIYEDVIRQSPWPGAQTTWSPIGYRDVPADLSAITPVYPFGLPLLMAALQTLFGFCAAFWVVPITAAAAVWLTYDCGRRICDREDVALGGAVLLAASPVFLNQAMGPLSDVPATAAWTLALGLLLGDRPLASGLAGTMAIAIRPNLVPAALALLVWTSLADAHDPQPRGRFATRTVRLVLGLAPSIAATAYLNGHLFGSPLRSGYGDDVRDLYSWGYLWRNASQFAVWASQTDTPVLALSGLFFIAPRLLAVRRTPFLRVLLGVFIAVVLLSYLFYRPYEAWWYLRFLLPMWPVVMILTVAAIDAIVGRWLSQHNRQVAVGVIVAVLASHGMLVAVHRGVFDRWRDERRYVEVARFIAATTDPAAVFISWQESGSIRLYADRLTLNFAALDRGWLDRVVERLRALGRRPYFVIEGFEVETFRQRFSASNRLGALDWAPLAVFESPYVAIYDPIRKSAGAPPYVIAPSLTRPRQACPQPAVWPPKTHLE
jgi:hypothetical protein